MNQNEIFAANLITKRKQKGLTQTAFAEELKVKRVRVSNWEMGRCFPKPNILTRICEILEVDDLYLFLSKKIEVKSGYAVWDKENDQVLLTV